MKPHSFCETPHENCTLNYCDENGCLNRNRELVEECNDCKEVLVPMIPNVDCRDGKEIGVWMKGWEEGYKEAKETLYTKEQVMDAIRLARQIDYCNADYEIIVSLKLK